MENLCRKVITFIALKPKQSVNSRGLIYQEIPVSITNSSRHVHLKENFTTDKKLFFFFFIVISSAKVSEIFIRRC